jgi:anti-sigma factor RsiW
MAAPREDSTLDELLRRHATRHAPPPALADRIRAQLPAQAGPAPVPAQPWWRGRWIGSLGLYGAGALSAWVAASALLWVQPPGDALRGEVLANHLRSLQAGHLTDVPSSSHHTVKPWFAGRLDFSPPVPDLAGQGYPLVGGRLDYLDGRTVAALVYRHDAHLINLFVWPAPPDAPADSAPQATAERGYQMLRWRAQGMQAWAVSDMAAPELRAFAEAVRTQSARADADR